MSEGESRFDTSELMNRVWKMLSALRRVPAVEISEKVMLPRRMLRGPMMPVIARLRPHLQETPGRRSLRCAPKQ